MFVWIIKANNTVWKRKKNFCYKHFIFESNHWIVDRLLRLHKVTAWMLFLLRYQPQLSVCKFNLPKRTRFETCKCWSNWTSHSARLGEITYIVYFLRTETTTTIKLNPKTLKKYFKMKDVSHSLKQKNMFFF